MTSPAEIHTKPDDFWTDVLDVYQIESAASLYVAALKPSLMELPCYFIVYLSQLEIIK